jgi:hypothetical protein
LLGHERGTSRTTTTVTTTQPDEGDDDDEEDDDKDNDEDEDDDDRDGLPYPSELLMEASDAIAACQCSCMLSAMNISYCTYCLPCISKYTAPTASINTTD